GAGLRIELERPATLDFFVPFQYFPRTILVESIAQWAIALARLFLASRFSAFEFAKAEEFLGGIGLVLGAGSAESNGAYQDHCVHNAPSRSRAVTTTLRCPHWHRRLPLADPDPAELRVARP